MSALTVRKVADGEELGGFAPVWPGAADAALAAEPGGSFVVVEEGRVVGVVVASETPAALRIHGVHVAGSAAADVLAAALAARPQARVELTVDAAEADIAAIAQQVGMTAVRRHVQVRGSLDAVVRPVRRPLTFRTSAEVGRRSLLALLAAIWSGGATPTGLGVRGELDALLDGARAADGEPDTSLWRIAYHGGEPAGVLLALVLPDRRGAIQYLGLLPGQRGRGLGGALHAEGLWLLRSAGARTYEDGTAVENAAMRRLFARAGLEEEGTSLLLVRDPSPLLRPASETAAPRLPAGAHVSLLRKARVARPS